MAKIVFEVTDRDDKNIITAVHAVAKDSGYEMTLYLETDTGKVIYSATIKTPAFGVEIVLDSEESASCSVPPCIPEVMAGDVSDVLDMMHDVVAAARELIRKEQENNRR